MDLIRKLDKLEKRIKQLESEKHLNISDVKKLIPEIKTVKPYDDSKLVEMINKSDSDIIEKVKKIVDKEFVNKLYGRKK